MERLQKITFFDRQTSITGMPQMAQPSSSCAAEFTTSLAPMTRTTSKFSMSGLTSSISRTHSWGTPASASSTFIWPGMRPATGWTPNFRAMLFFRNMDASSPIGVCARAMAMPYPGTTRTSLAFTSMSAQSSTLHSTCSLGPSSAPLTTATLFRPPNRTLKMSRFIASHMIFVRIAPEKPIKEPTMVSTLLFSRKPSATRAQPE
mmetsp:Transcript_10068/g.18736  ORF Transcript_10068/g.18736 Transcript_10068/m.18736 type:complete len:204 (-) Transcript_10068:1297-1908(-)